MKNETTNILFCGIGGQGVLKASEIAAHAAMLAGYHVKKSEVHGMSQRGGSVDSHLRFGTKVYSPLIAPGKAHYLVPFAAEEGIPMVKFLAKSGINLTNQLAIAQENVQDRKFINTYMLGILASYLTIPVESWFASLSTVLPRLHDENREVFIKGREFGENNHDF